MSRFEKDTSVRALGEGGYEGHVHPDWWIVRGPNGGYMAALLVRAMQAEVADATRQARSLTVHFASPPEPGAAHLQVTLERRGRSLSTVSARMEQQGKLIALGLGAFSRARESPEFAHAAMPEVPPPEDCQPLHPSMKDAIPFRQRFESRLAVGGVPWSGSPEAVSGGWIRLADGGHPLDAALVTTLSDAWPPAVFAWAREGSFFGGVPTVDLSVHFRAPLPPEGLAPDAWTLVVFRTRFVRDGFLEEDGEIWSPDGTLLAHSRQLAVLI